MVNCMYTCTMTCIVVLLLRSLMLSKNAFTYSTVRYIIYCIALGHNGVSRLQEMSRFQGVHIYMYMSSIQCIYYTILACAEGLHFSALVINVLPSSLPVATLHKNHM